MNIDWSKAPKGYDFHIQWTNMEADFYRDEGDRYARDCGYYAEKSDLLRMPKVIVTRRPWNGEGLPPVGTVCEHEGSNGWSNPEICEVIAHRAFEGHADGELLVVCATKTDVWFSSACCFRPIRTPEQIAAEERDKAIKEMAEDLGIMHTTAAQAYDKGYRKIES